MHGGGLFGGSVLNSKDSSGESNVRTIKAAEKVEIRRAVLEKSLDYLVCPKDKAQLQLSVDSSLGDKVSDGEFRCSQCQTVYPIKNGVPYFFRDEKYSWDGINTFNLEIFNLEKIARIILENQDDPDLTWRRIVSLPKFFMQGLVRDNVKARKKAIENINCVCDLLSLSFCNATFLLQAITAAKYNLEDYRGTFLVPRVIITDFSFFMRESNYKLTATSYYKPEGIVVEGACADGENLFYLANNISSQFYLGVDIASSMVREAQKKARGDMLFVQGDICQLPLRKNSVGFYVTNNVFDRVTNPKQASLEAGRIVAANKCWVLANCDPLQYSYNTPDGEKSFVPSENQISLEQGFSVGGFREVGRINGVWNIRTLSFGQEQLPYKCLLGQREIK